MIIRLYLDDDSLDKALVKALRLRDVDVVTALEVGMGARDDEEHLEYATEQGRVLCSFNRGDFCRLNQEWLASGKSHAGIILAFQQGYDIRKHIRGLLNLIELKTAEEMRDQVEFLSR
ncbi:MAG: DUF5615 family PIN-like protein [Blastocatellia bacterium]